MMQFKGVTVIRYVVVGAIMVFFISAVAILSHQHVTTLRFGESHTDTAIQQLSIKCRDSYNNTDSLAAEQRFGHYIKIALDINIASKVQNF